MKNFLLKKQARQFYLNVFNRIAARYNEDDLREDALVFSPHFDDETLGCGGTILKKTGAGAVVGIVFMTDGSKSHSRLMSAKMSRRIRRQEGRAAARALGLRESDTILLDFEETRLDAHEETAIDRVREILLTRRPGQVFVPYHKEPLLWSADHLVTNKIVVSALHRIGRATRVFEYPIWFWCHWPWARLPLRRRRDFIRHMMNHGFLRGANLLRDFRCVVPVKEFLDRKRAALEEHRSQMTQLIPSVQWRTLSDVADGDFLKCFFQGYEIFHTHSIPSWPTAESQPVRATPSRHWAVGCGHPPTRCQ